MKINKETSSQNENETRNLCKYCHKLLEKVDCAKYEQSDEYAFSIHEVITFVLYVISLFLPSFRDKVEKHKYKITCTNKDCIEYLKGCYVNKHNYTNTIFEYQFPKRRNKKDIT